MTPAAYTYVNPDPMLRPDGYPKALRRYMAAIDEHGMDSQEARDVAARYPGYAIPFARVAERLPTIDRDRNDNDDALELQATAVERYREALIRHNGIRAKAAEELGVLVQSLTATLGLQPPVAPATDDEILAAFNETGNASEAAESLGYSRRSFDRRLKAIRQKQYV